MATRFAPDRRRAAGGSDHAIGQTDDRQRVRTCSWRSLRGQLGQEERELDVLERRQDRDQIVELEDEPDVAGRQRASSDSLIEEMSRPSMTMRPLVGVDPGAQVEERRLARSRRPHGATNSPLPIWRSISSSTGIWSESLR